MEPRELPPAAEDIRIEIREMIPETATTNLPVQDQDTHSKLDEYGNKVYEGDILARKISLLTWKMDIGTEWRWRLVYWPKPAKLRNDRNHGYLIPLSKDISLTPGGKVQEGYYVEVTDEPILSSRAAAIFIVPL